MVAERRLASENQVAPGQRVGRVRARFERQQVRGHDLEDVDAMPLDVLGHGLRMRDVSEVDPLQDAAHVAQELPVLDRHAARCPGGARGEEHVGELLRRAGPTGIRKPLSVADLLDPEHVQAARQQALQPVIGQRHGNPGVRQHLADPFAGEARIERQVGASGLEHAEQGDDGFERALQGESDRHLGADSEGRQPMGHRVGPRVQLGVGEEAVLEHHRGRLGHAARLGLEQGVDRSGLLPFAAALLPIRLELAALARGEQGQLVEPAVRGLSQPRDQALQVPGHPPEGGFVPQLRLVGEGPFEGVVRLPDGQRPVELGRGVGELQGTDPQARQLGRAAGSVLEREHHLEERRVIQVPLGRQLLDQAFEGDVLVGVGVERGRADPAQQGTRALAVRQPGAEGERVHEQADQRLDLGARAVRDGSAHHQVGVPGVAFEQSAEAAEQGHEERRGLVPGEGSQPRGLGLAEPPGEGARCRASAR